MAYCCLYNVAEWRIDDREPREVDDSSVPKLNLTCRTSLKQPMGHHAVASMCLRMIGVGHCGST